MNVKRLSRLTAAFLVTAICVSVLGLTAFAEDPQPCRICETNGLTFTGFVATTEFEKISQTECARVYECNNGHRQLTYNQDGTYRDTSDHVASENATCTQAAVCGNCHESFGAPLNHSIVVDAAVPATCTQTGLTEGRHCDRCGEILVAQNVVATLAHTYDDGVITKPTCFKEGYTTYTCTVCGFKNVTDNVRAMSHWYAEWQPAGKGQNSAHCKRTNCTYIKTTDCVDWDFMLISAGAEEAEEYSVCPVCGELSDSGRLELVEDAKPTPVTGWTPEGDMVLRYGQLENGEKIICVSFEFDARLAQCTGVTKFTVPAELLEGYQLMLLDEEGGETELEVETKGERATFTLDFSELKEGKRTPVRMLHLVPISE